ncbi:MAG: polysaccharide biosynthesis protein [Taibaiella sp.]|nr:polysaccharide biosynthesis protein [Taibaiella sp.]
MALKIRILPRWLVFLLDLFLVCFCLFLSRSLKLNFSWPHIVVGLRSMTAVVLLLNAALFYIFKSYAGIVRYTNIEDTSRLVMVNAISSFFYLAVNIFIYHSQNFFTLQVVTINFFISSFVIISYRLAVRYCFQFYKLYTEGGRKDKKKVAVYNASANGLHIKNVMNNLPNGDMQVVAFIDDTLSGSGKLLEGVPIYNTTAASIEKLKNEGVELLIFVTKNIEKEKLNIIVDACLASNIRIQQVPTMRDWLNGKLDTQQLQNINIEDLLEREVIKIHNEAIYTELKGKRILVTGAAGSIGSELVRQLLNYRPGLIILCDQAETPMHEFFLEVQEKYKNANVKAYLGDITDRQRMEHLFEVFNPQIVFHAAAYKHVPLMEDNPSIAVLNNVLGTKNLAELSVAYDVEKFVMVSTDKAVNPTNVMGASKRIAEIFTQSFYNYLTNDLEQKDGGHSTTKFVTTRFGNVLGSNGSVIPRFKKQLEAGGPITVTHPDITRYFMTIPEACILVLEAGVMGKGGEIFVFDMGAPVKIADLAKKVIRLAGKEPDVDIRIVYTGLRPGEKLYEELLNNAENTRQTYHEKILIADVRQYNFDDISKRVDKLINTARQHYTMETVYLMKDLVPEFVSNNVNYEKVNVEK